MVQRTATAENEPEERKFDIPSAKEHLLQVADILEDIDTDPDIVHAKLEVVGGDEEGRSLLHRCCLDDSRKEFYFTRMFLKAIGCQYKGSNFAIDSDEWQGKQAYGRVEHSKDGKYANVAEWSFDKMVENPATGIGGGQDKETKPDGEPVVWDD